MTEDETKQFRARLMTAGEFFGPKSQRKLRLWEAARARGYQLNGTAQGCSSCGKTNTVVPLSYEHLLAEVKRGTTHVCHPAIGGCNHGFAK